MNIASIYWEPNKENPTVWYMLTNQSYEVIIEPTSITVSDIQENLESIFKHIDEETKQSEYSVKYKTVIKRHNKHKIRDDSLLFHNTLLGLIRKKKVRGDRSQALLKGKELRDLLKRALQYFQIKNTPKQEVDLWSICLKTGRTENGVKKAIMGLWKRKNKSPSGKSLASPKQVFREQNMNT